jgi:serine kinase of HPr protein (carbohydrate metabolism regulator)
MTTRDLRKALGLKVFCEGAEREITSGYCGDLLSWVMSRAKKDSAWITVMTNVNVAAVAVLCDVSCIILSADAAPDSDLLYRAETENIALYGSGLDSFSLCVKIDELLRNKK